MCATGGSHTPAVSGGAASMLMYVCIEWMTSPEHRRVTVNSADNVQYGNLALWQVCQPSDSLCANDSGVLWCTTGMLLDLTEPVRFRNLPLGSRVKTTEDA